MDNKTHNKSTGGDGREEGEGEMEERGRRRGRKGGKEGGISRVHSQEITVCFVVKVVN